MVVIFGFGPGKGEDLGEVAPIVCPNCHNEVFLHHIRSKKTISLYFIPVVPYGTDEYLVCPICTHGTALAKAQTPAVRAMAASTTSGIETLPRARCSTSPTVSRSARASSA